jgi:Integral membrane protein, interacts with FtsH
VQDPPAAKFWQTEAIPAKKEKMAFDISIKQANEQAQRKFLSGVYQWMVLALAISGAVAWLVAGNPAVQRLVFGNVLVFFALVIGEFALVWWLSAAIRHISVRAAGIAFVAYSVLNGLTLSGVFLLYTGTSVVRIFAITALMFGGMSLYGLKTKSDLRSMGRYLVMALIGIVIAGLVNLFLASTWLDMLISMVTVVVFTGLTAYDTQKLLAAANQADGSEVFHKVAIIGALELYLDFINIFLALLRLFGNRD